ncbi:MAG: RNA-binding protein [Bacillaceae bacterium]
MSLYDHFREDERPFIERILDYKAYVEQNYAPKLLPFLSPREQQIVATLIGTTGDVLVAFFGGTTETERKRALLYPSYYEWTEDDFDLSLFEIKYAVKFCSIEHPQVLGSILGTGIKREKLGDILLHDNRVQFFICKEMDSYLISQLQKVGRTTVQLEKKTLSEALFVEESWIEKSGTVSSLRLDTIVSEIYNISRQKVQPYIKSGAVAVNWRVQESGSFTCCEGDIFSVRGLGRGKLIHIDGKTKKDKWRITFGIKK